MRREFIREKLSQKTGQAKSMTGVSGADDRLQRTERP